MAMIFGGAALSPLLVAIFWLAFGDFNLTTVLISVGISSLVELMGVALLINARKSFELFRTGRAVVGRVSSVKASRGSYCALEVEFLGSSGTLQVGSVVRVGGLSVREGDPVAVLTSQADPRRFAIYSPGHGMMAGGIKR